MGYCYYWKLNPAILDVGCGQGILHEKLNIGSYSSYKGIDISSEAILQAAHKIDHNTDFQVANILDFRTKELFDVINNGYLNIKIGQTYLLEEITRAHHDLETRNTIGSTVLLPNG